MNIFSAYIYTCRVNIYIVISTAQTDFGLRSFSLNINKLPTFSEITQAWQYLKIVFIRSDDCVYTVHILNFNFKLLNLRYRPPTPNIKIYTKQQKHSTVTTKKFAF